MPLTHRQGFAVRQTECLPHHAQTCRHSSNTEHGFWRGISIWKMLIQTKAQAASFSGSREKHGGLRKSTGVQRPCVWSRFFFLKESEDLRAKKRVIARGYSVHSGQVWQNKVKWKWAVSKVRIAYLYLINLFSFENAFSVSSRQHQPYDIVYLMVRFSHPTLNHLSEANQAMVVGFE